MKWIAKWSRVDQLLSGFGFSLQSQNILTTFNRIKNNNDRADLWHYDVNTNDNQSSACLRHIG